MLSVKECNVCFFNIFHGRYYAHKTCSLTGKGKHGEEVRKKSLAGFFKDVNNTESKPDSHQKNKTSQGKHKQNSTVKINSVSNHPKNYKLNVSQATLSKAFSENERSHKKNPQHSNTDKTVIRQLLCKLFNLSKSHNSCKENVHSKKAMIWPTKMIPWLKRILMNKLNGGGVNPVSYFNMETDAADSPFREGALNNMMDNWDSNFPFIRAHRKHHHGLKMVPLLKMLRAKLRGENWSPSEFGTLNDALNGEGYNGFGPVPTQSSASLVQQLLGQTLGNSNRNTVLNEMIQEFLLANNQEHQASEDNEPFSELTGRNNLAQFNNGLQGPMIIPEPSQGVGFRQLDGINVLQGNMRRPIVSPDEPIHAQMLDNGAIAPMPRQPLGASMMKNEPILGESLIGRSPLLEGTLRASSMSSFPLSSPAISNSQIQSSFFEESPRESPREESLLQKAGGFDVPILPSSQRIANPTQRMYTESAGRQQISEGELTALARNQARESLLSGSRGRGGNMILEEISDSLARGTRPTRFNALVDAHSDLGESERPSYSRLSRLESNSFQRGLRLPVGSNTLGIASVLSKGQDAPTTNQRSWAFRREKVLKGTLKSHLQSKNHTAIPSPKHVQGST